MALEFSVFQRLQMFFTSDDALAFPISQFVALICVCIMLGHLIVENPGMNECINYICIGLCSGVVILLFSRGKISHLLMFSEDLPFICLLPTIIFIAGFQVKNELLPILTAIMSLGTLTSGIFISIYGLRQIFGSMDISSPKVYRAIGAICAVFLGFAFFCGNFLLVFVASLLLGIVTGELSVYIIEKLYIGRHSTNREVALMMLMTYLSYMLVELWNQSGILSVFFFGIVMSHYTWPNVTEDSGMTTRRAFATLSFAAKTFVFLYVGRHAVDSDKWLVRDSPGTSIVLSSVLLLPIPVGRAICVFLLSSLLKWITRSPNETTSFRQQVIIGWAGFMRLVLSLALACNQFTLSGHTQLRSNAIRITGSITVVLFCMVVYGFLRSRPRHNQRDTRSNNSQIDRYRRIKDFSPWKYMQDRKKCKPGQVKRASTLLKFAFIERM